CQKVVPRGQVGWPANGGAISIASARRRRGGNAHSRRRPRPPSHLANVILAGAPPRSPGAMSRGTPTRTLRLPERGHLHSSPPYSEAAAAPASPALLATCRRLHSGFHAR